MEATDPFYEADYEPYTSSAVLEGNGWGGKTGTR